MKKSELIQLIKEVINEFKWEQLYNNYYLLHNDLVFCLKEINIGIFNKGKAFQLTVRKRDGSGNTKIIADFWTHSDGDYKSYLKRSVDHKLWNSIEEIQKRTIQGLTNKGYLK
jgi:hypothetical protein